MKVALLTPTFSAYSGIDRLVAQEADEHLAQGDDVTIVALRATMKSRARIVELGMPRSPTMERLYRLFFFLDFAKVRKAAAMLKGYDTVISFFYPMNLIASRAKKQYGIRYVYYNPGVADARLFSSIHEKVSIGLFRLFTRMSMRDADEIISISKFLCDELKRETGRDSTVKYPAIDKKRFRIGLSGAAIRKKHNLGSAPVLLFVGRVSPHKGVHLLLQAFMLVKEKFPDARLLIVGKQTFGSYMKKLKSMAGSSVEFVGFVEEDELPQYYAACSLYVTCTMWEGFDIPVVEAQACGKKVVAFDVGAHREIVRKGALVEPGNVGKFANAVIRLMD